jgi:hypothetical protein
MKDSKELNQQQPTSVEASRRLRDLRQQIESRGFDPDQSPSYRRMREVLSEALGGEIDAWKQRAGYAKAERDEGRGE